MKQDINFLLNGQCKSESEFSAINVVKNWIWEALSQCFVGCLTFSWNHCIFHSPTNPFGKKAIEGTTVRFARYETIWKQCNFEDTGGFVAISVGSNNNAFSKHYGIHQALSRCCNLPSLLQRYHAAPYRSLLFHLRLFHVDIMKSLSFSTKEGWCAFDG